MFSQWNMLKYIKTFCYLVIFTKITLVHCSLCEVSVSFSKMCHVSLGRFWICFPLSPTVEVRWLVSMYISCGYLTCEMERELTVAPLLVFWSIRDSWIYQELMGWGYPTEYFTAAVILEMASPRRFPQFSCLVKHQNIHLLFLDEVLLVDEKPGLW